MQCTIVLKLDSVDRTGLPRLCIIGMCMTTQCAIQVIHPSPPKRSPFATVFNYWESLCCCLFHLLFPAESSSSQRIQAGVYQGKTRRTELEKKLGTLHPSVWKGATENVRARKSLGDPCEHCVRKRARTHKSHSWSGIVYPCTWPSQLGEKSIVWEQAAGVRRCILSHVTWNLE